MPTYTFRCGTCGDLDRRFPMAEVPAQVDCETCGHPAPRSWTSVATIHGSSPARTAIENAARSASEPAVVSSVPGGGARRPVSRNPLHAKLPRP